jgi:hypothetical protein
MKTPQTSRVELSSGNIGSVVKNRIRVFTFPFLILQYVTSGVSVASLSNHAKSAPNPGFFSNLRCLFDLDALSPSEIWRADLNVQIMRARVPG